MSTAAKPPPGERKSPPCCCHIPTGSVWDDDGCEKCREVLRREKAAEVEQ